MPSPRLGFPRSEAWPIGPRAGHVGQRKALTQQDVAAEGVTYRYLQEIERGERNPSVKMLFDLAQVLDVRVADLVEVGERRAPEFG